MTDEKKELKESDKFDRKNSKWVFLKKLITSIREDEIMPLAASVAYYLISSIVPFMIVFITLALKIASNNLDMIMKIADIVPDQAISVLIPLVDNIIETSSTSLVSISILTALMSCSAGARNLIRAMDIAFKIPKQEQSFLKSFFKRTFKSVSMTLLLILMVFVTLTFLTFGGSIEDLLVRTFGESIGKILSIVRYFIPIISMVIGFSIMFKYGPNFHTTSIRWSSAIIGGLLTAIGWTIISAGYSFYVTNISNMSMTYGPLVGIFVLFVWLYISATIVIVVSEIISTYDQFKKGIFYST
ncbi:MAG: YihY/virulence factor BrkB family protein [Finegoldia sp.]|nr:YihY/virulence factor BrkB family protein [Finegoldia sp.]